MKIKCGINYQADLIRIGYRAYTTLGENEVLYRGMWSKISKTIMALNEMRI